ncbi:RolB family protein (plasmid) [Bradyrhizobium barranii subsp. apii]|uniref:RolB family protein n=1 Tax=Bradyrhizobium TaxID=374 RepID=UPI00205C893F|nr:RolB family protein [Bradyrhizobium barranii]UPU01561.1 RolB family protein [Bradyrhizobium barranii subsp. apii]
MAEHYPAYERPQFESVCLTGKTGDELRRALKNALKKYRKHLPKVLKEQRKWVAAARAYEQAAGIHPRNFGAFETEPCMTEYPLGGANEAIDVDDLSVDASDPPLWYVYLPTNIALSCVANSSFEAVSRRYFPGRVITMKCRPYDAYITPRSISGKYQGRWCNLVEREEMQYFLAIVRTDRFSDEENEVRTRDTKEGRFDIVAHGQMIWLPRMPVTDWPSASGWDD